MNHRLIRLLFGLLVALCWPTVSAAPADSEALHLHQLRLALQGTLGDFYLLYGVDADPQHSASIEQRLRLAQADLQALPAAPTTQFRAEWAAYEDQLRGMTATLLQHKELDGSTIAELIARHHRVLQLCSPPPGNESTLTPGDHTRQLQWQMQTIATNYIAYSVGANSLGGDGQDIGELARQFDSNLQALRPGAEQQRQFGDIQHKWRYIEPSLRNYQTSAIPSLVNRYATQIIAELDELHASSAQRDTPAN